MLRLTTHLLVTAVNPEALTQIRAMRSRRVTMPSALMAATKATVRSDYRPNPNGAKLYTAGIRRCRFERPRSDGRRQPRRGGIISRSASSDRIAIAWPIRSYA